jgi:hypothetical protein
MRQLRRLPPEQMQRAAVQLTVLSGLRMLSQRVKMELKRMPLDLDLSKNAVIKDFLEQARAEGARQFFQRLLEKRFGPLPRWVCERIEGAGLHELERLGVKASTAASLDEVFVRPPRNGRRT